MTTENEATWAYREGFKITSHVPSKIVSHALERGLVPQEAYVLDLGAGRNPRNALFLADAYRCTVDIVDLEPPEFPKGIDKGVLGRISSHVSSVGDFEIKKEQYNLAVLARLIQYLPIEEVEDLIRHVAMGLKMNGIMALSYTAEGGIHQRASEYGIETFQHSVDRVSNLLDENDLNVLSCQEGSSESTHVPHSGVSALTYDILAQRV